MCFYSLLQLFWETFLVLRKIQRDITINVPTYVSSKVPVILVSLSYLGFLARLSKNTQISNLVKNLAVGVQLLRTYGRTDITKLIITFHNLANQWKRCFIDNVVRDRHVILFYSSLKIQGEGSYQKLSHDPCFAISVAAILYLSLCPKGSPVALSLTYFFVNYAVRLQRCCASVL
jgi:hypothetical protein